MKAGEQMVSDLELAKSEVDRFMASSKSYINEKYLKQYQDKLHDLISWQKEYNRKYTYDTFVNMPAMLYAPMNETSEDKYGPKPFWIKDQQGQKEKEEKFVWF